MPWILLPYCLRIYHLMSLNVTGRNQYSGFFLSQKFECGSKILMENNRNIHARRQGLCLWEKQLGCCCTLGFISVGKCSIYFRQHEGRGTLYSFKNSFYLILTYSLYVKTKKRLFLKSTKRKSWENFLPTSFENFQTYKKVERTIQVVINTHVPFTQIHQLLTFYHICFICECIFVTNHLRVRS